MRKYWFRLTSLALALVLSLGMLALSPQPAQAGCQCVQTAIHCYYSDGSWIIIFNHPACALPV
jgi:hypothetical protein